MPRGTKKIKPSFEESEEDMKQECVKYNDVENEYYGYLTKRLDSAVNQRIESFVELDDSTYDDKYETNQKAANSYNPPKENEEDSRIVTGTTHEKEMSILSALLNLNLQGEIMAFDKGDMLISELGAQMEDMVKKSRKMEEYDFKRPLIYKEFLDQGTCFVEEIQAIKFEVEKEVTNNSANNDPLQTRWKTRVKKMLPQCECNLIPGKNVYLGNIREFFIKQQPYLFTIDQIPYDVAKYIYGDWSRFQYVPKKLKTFKEMYSDTEGVSNFWYTGEIEDNMVQVVKYQDAPNNEYMIILNGVMMLPVGYPLTEVSPSGEYTLSKGDAEVISRFFAYSKSIPAKTSVDQGVVDMMLRMILLAMKKGVLPPMANSSNRILSRKVLWPGKITKGIKASDLEEIGTNNGLSTSMITAFEMLTNILSEKSVNPVFTGDQVSGSPTATQINTMQQQQMVKLGLTIYGLINLEVQMIEHRVHNILHTWTTPIDQKIDKVKNELVDVFRSFSLDSSTEKGENALKIIEFNAEKADSLTSKEVMDEENKLGRVYRRKVRKVYINPEKMRNLDIIWSVNVNATQKDSSQLERVMFKQDLQDAANLFGMDSVNTAYAKERYAIMIDEDPRKFFVQEAPAKPLMSGSVELANAQKAATASGSASGTSLATRQNPMQASVQAQKGELEQPALARLLNK